MGVGLEVGTELESDTPKVGEGAPIIQRLSLHLSELSPQPMVAVEGMTHVVIYANPAFARLVGIECHDLVGRPFTEAVPEGHGNGCAALLDRVYRTGEPEGIAEQEHLQPNVRPVYWSYSMWAVLGLDDRPAGLIIHISESTEIANFRMQAVAMNEALVHSAVRQHELIESKRVSEQARRDLEAQMLIAHKLESLGILAGGIAHDLNNMLTPVLGYTEMACDVLTEDSPVRPLLEDVSMNARRAADLVAQVLAYAGRGSMSLGLLDLSDLVQGMDLLLRSATPSRIKLRYELAAGLPPVVADPTQLQQVILNLVTNAVEASGPGGVITVRTTSVMIAPEMLWSAHLKVHLPAGSYASLEVADGGSGMTPEVMARIFDPFFTTKFVGRGLGLAAVQGIAHGHGGVMCVESKVGRGSTLRLILPCANVDGE